jgi:alanyl-tRNA synthetase
VQSMDASLTQIAAALKATPSVVNSRLQQVLDNVKALEKELAQLKSKMASSQGKDMAGEAIAFKGVKILSKLLPQADAKTLRETMDQLKSQLGTAVVVLAAMIDGKVQLAAGVTADTTAKVKAGELVNFVALQVGGKGGGRPDMAMAGGTDPSQLDQALASVQEWVQSRL